MHLLKRLLLTVGELVRVQLLERRNERRELRRAAEILELGHDPATL